MNRSHLVTVIVCLISLLFSGVAGVRRKGPEGNSLTVGFLYENDESTPNTYNFAMSSNMLQKTYGDNVRILTHSNVRESDVDGTLRSLARGGCNVIFTNTHASIVPEVAKEYPNVQFCQVSIPETGTVDRPKNYHTFNGKIHQGWYASGVVAGLKLRELLDSQKITRNQAMVGFVAGRETAEEISAFTAFLLGVRSEAPEAMMRVRYTDAQSNYTRERACAQMLIDEGCKVIAQHTPTIGPALACEEAAGRVYHIGYSMSMIDVATATSLVSARVNWTLYVSGAVRAILAGEPIERSVPGDAHGQDLSAGFERGWVELLDLNEHIAAPGTKERLRQVTQEFARGRRLVFQGDYKGTDPENSEDTCDLTKGYRENKDGSWATFHYILNDIVSIER